jgi:hypothetical protein
METSDAGPGLFLAEEKKPTRGTAKDTEEYCTEQSIGTESLLLIACGLIRRDRLSASLKEATIHLNPLRRAKLK